MIGGGINIAIGIGIDTGGTYTDAVILDIENKTILGASKALTTKEDLSIGILQALDALPGDYIKQCGMISLSTTLATNACVEDRGGNAALIFFGGDHRVINKYGAEYGLPKTDEIYLQESYSTFSGGFEREPDWEKFQEAVENNFFGLDGIGIIEIYAMKNSAEIEKKAKEIFLQKHNITVVCGHELFNELNSLRRGASTLLNARLFPVIKSFINAIIAAVAERGANAPLFIVRSDGSLMSDKYANIRPVETLLCGPAASVMGCAYLSNERDNIIIDMGGTTTDIAIIKEGIPIKAVGGVQVGKWKTFVSGLYIKTFGLGGDSAVHYKNNRMILEEYRVVPLCVAAEKYPCIINNLEKLLSGGNKHMKYMHEHYVLLKDIDDNPRYTDDEKTLCWALKAGPLSLREAAECVSGRDVFNFDSSRLIKDEIIQCIGFTPTDVMHIKGDFVKYPVEASELGARYVAMNLDVSVDEVCNLVYDEIKRKLYKNVIVALLENKELHYRQQGVGKDIERLIDESYCAATSGREFCSNVFVSSAFTTDYKLTGVGAPIRIFLEDVAGLLGSSAIIPEHYEVANAIGAIVGSVSVNYTVDIRPNYSSFGISGYTVSGLIETRIFENIKEAEAFAASEAIAGARAEAYRRGARGEIETICALEVDEADSGEYRIHIGTRAVARAIGASGLM